MCGRRLRRAGASEADLLIAVTGSDEVNMIACQVCFSLFKTPRKIARVRAADYLDKEGFFSQENMPIDVLINPEQVVTPGIYVNQVVHIPNPEHESDLLQAGRTYP